MKQFVAFVGLALALAASTACQAHAGVKINDPSRTHHVSGQDDAQQRMKR